MNISKSIALFLTLAIVASANCHPVSFVIEGKVERITSSHTITLEIRGRKTTAGIQKDGSFYIRGTIEYAGEAFIKTDSTYSPAYLWIDTGNTCIRLQEQRLYQYQLNDPRNGRLQTSRVMLFITDVSGTEDTYLYYYNNILSLSLISYNAEKTDSLLRSIELHIIDSVFQVRPASAVLPFYIHFYAESLGVPLVNRYFHMLSASQQFSERGVFIAKFLTLQTALTKDSVFYDFSIPDNAGKLIKLSDITSDYVLIDFWASWCGPCRANHPYLKRAYALYRNKGFSIISISLDEDKQDWLHAIEKDGLVWHNACDLKGYSGELAQRCKLYAVPYSVLLDKNRKIIAFDKMGADLLETLKKLL